MYAWLIITNEWMNDRLFILTQTCVFNMLSISGYMFSILGYMFSILGYMFSIPARKSYILVVVTSLEQRAVYHRINKSNILIKLVWYSIIFKKLRCIVTDLEIFIDTSSHVGQRHDLTIEISYRPISEELRSRTQ